MKSKIISVVTAIVCAAALAGCCVPPSCLGHGGTGSGTVSMTTPAASSNLPA